MRNIILLILLCFSLNSTAQISFHFLQGKKSTYNVSDIIELQVQLISQPQTCKEGMKQAKIFVSGLSIESQSDWNSSTKGVWLKQIKLRIIDNGKQKAKLTVMRKVDKESLFHQEEFSIKKTNE